MKRREMPSNDWQCGSTKSTQKKEEGKRRKKILRSQTTPEIVNVGRKVRSPGDESYVKMTQGGELRVLRIIRGVGGLFRRILEAEDMKLPRAFFVLASVGVALGQEFKCPDKTGYFPDPYQCDLYYECSRGVAEPRLCPDGLVFKDGDPNRERCDIPSNVDCGDRTDLQEAQPSPGCPRANGYYRHPDPQICDKFYSCVNGQFHELPCPPGLIFDDIASTCAWPLDSKRTDCTNSKRDTLDDGFSCPVDQILDQNGRPLPHPTFPHPTDCTKFYICRNGVVPQRGSCSGGSVYNKVTFMCDEPENVPDCRDWLSKKKS